MTQLTETRPHDTWIQTFTGRQFWPLDPRVEDVDIKDIAHSLSMQCRYLGHTKYFYSVAQHCVLASMHSSEPKWALMHDAGEAYSHDIVRPLKRAIDDFERIEMRLLEVVAEKFGLSLPLPEEIKRIDYIMLATERRDLMTSPPVPWLAAEQVEPLDDIINPWEPEIAETIFLNRFSDLFAV